MSSTSTPTSTSTQPASSSTSTPTRPPPPTQPQPSAPSQPTGFSSIFQSPGGPPLILVCIAAGLLLGAFTGVLLMRRMRPALVGRAPGAGAGVGGAGRRAGALLGEKPRLLDVHILPREEGNGKGRGAEAEAGVMTEEHTQEQQGPAVPWRHLSVSPVSSASSVECRARPEA